MFKYKKLCLIHGLCTRDRISDFPPPPTTSTEGCIKKFITATVSVSSRCTCLMLSQNFSSIQNSTRSAWSRHFEGRGEMGGGGGGKECGSPRDEWNMLVPSPWHSVPPFIRDFYPAQRCHHQSLVTSKRTDGRMNEWMNGATDTSLNT